MQTDEELLDLQFDLISHLHEIDGKEKKNENTLETVILPYHNSYLLYLDNLEKVRKNNNINNLAISINDVDITDKRKLMYEIINWIEAYPKIFYPFLTETDYADTKLSTLQKEIVGGAFAWQEFNSILQKKKIKIPVLTGVLWGILKTPKWIRKFDAQLTDIFRTKKIHNRYRDLAYRISYKEVDTLFMNRKIFRSDYDLGKTINDINNKIDPYLLSTINIPKGEFPESHYKAALIYLILDLSENKFTAQEKEYYLNVLMEFKDLHKKFFPVLNEIEKQHYKKH